MSRPTGALRLVLPLLLAVSPALVGAQSPTTTGPGMSPAGPSSSMQARPASPAIQASDSARELHGSWQHQQHDKEHDETETTVIEIKADGSYNVQTHSTRRELQKQKPLRAKGRYFVEKSDASGHQLRFEGESGEPGVGKDEMVTRVKLTVSNGKTMTTNEGLSLVRIQ